MIYFMATSEFPFDATTEWAVFERVKNCDVQYPKDMDPDIKDIIAKILIADP